MRKRLNKEQEAKLLEKCGRRCSLCYGLNNDSEIKKGQIRSLKISSKKPKLINYVFLCLNHSEEFRLKTNRSKGISVEEIKIHREKLYKDLAENKLKEKHQESKSRFDYKWIIGTLIALGILTIGYCNLKINKQNQEVPLDQCNRFQDEGCTLDLSTETNPHTVTYTQDLLDKGYKPLTMISIDAGGIMSMMQLQNGQFQNFPGIRDNPDMVSPFKAGLAENKLLLKGILEDYDSSEPLGWFDENEFEIMKTQNGGCAYSFNKDQFGIEIVNINQEVCFSLDLNRGNWQFKGYFKDDEQNIYIFNETQHITKDPVEARKLIKQIKPIFDHMSKSDTLGQRVIPLKHRSKSDISTKMIIGK